MSYILDALKKSEQERLQQEQAANGITVAELANHQNESGNGLLIVIAVASAILFVLAAVLFVSQPQSVSEPQTAKEIFTEPEVVVTPTTAFTTTPQTQADANPTVQPQAPSKPATPTKPFSTPRSTTQATTPTATLATAAQPVIAAETAAPTKPKTLLSAQETVTPKVPEEASKKPGEVKRAERELPPLSSLSAVPDLIISGHIYSSVPEKRSISMNGRDWQEGDPINARVFIEEITPKGLRLNVDGWPLNINRSQGWQAIGIGSNQ